MDYLTISLNDISVQDLLVLLGAFACLFKGVDHGQKFIGGLS